jgi:hypothetical protein
MSARSDVISRSADRVRDYRDPRIRLKGSDTIQICTWAVLPDGRLLEALRTTSDQTIDLQD